MYLPKIGGLDDSTVKAISHNSFSITDDYTHCGHFIKTDVETLWIWMPQSPMFNHYPVDGMVYFVNTYPVISDLSQG